MSQFVQERPEEMRRALQLVPPDHDPSLLGFPHPEDFRSCSELSRLRYQTSPSSAPKVLATRPSDHLASADTLGLGSMLAGSAKLRVEAHRRCPGRLGTHGRSPGAPIKLRDVQSRFGFVGHVLDDLFGQLNPIAHLSTGNRRDLAGSPSRLDVDPDAHFRIS